jgi:hypothetical protein
MSVRLPWDSKKKLEEELADKIITDSTTYTARTVKYRAIVVGTGSAPTPTGYPDYTLFAQYIP